MTRKVHLSFWLAAALVFSFGLVLMAREFVPSGAIQRSLVVQVDESEVPPTENVPGGWQQTVTLALPYQEQTLQSFVGSEFQPLQDAQRLSVNDEVLISETDIGPILLDRYRLPAIAGLFGLFVVLVVALTGRQGIAALLGMAITFITLLGGLIPWLLQGGDPVLATALWAVAMAITTTYLSHGWNRTSHLALISMLIVLGAVGLLSQAAVLSLGLTGFGSEEALFLQVGTSSISMRGIFLAGVLLGVLGVLDDICIAQVAVVEELVAAKPNIQVPELWQRSLRIGKAHVVSLVNTLILAYASANLPLFLLFVINQSQLPWWAAINSEVLAEEIVRTLGGSIGLVLAVPISSALAAFSLKHLKDILPEATSTEHKHSH